MIHALSNDARTILTALIRFGGSASWYELGRVVVGRLERPGAWSSTLRDLVSAGLLIETESVGEGMSVLSVTDRGREAVLNPSDP
jgi:hypothetical protein